MYIANVFEEGISDARGEHVFQYDSKEDVISKPIYVGPRTMSNINISSTYLIVNTHNIVTFIHDAITALLLHEIVTYLKIHKSSVQFGFLVCGSEEGRIYTVKLQRGEYACINCSRDMTTPCISRICYHNVINKIDHDY